MINKNKKTNAQPTTKQNPQASQPAFVIGKKVTRPTKPTRSHDYGNTQKTNEKPTSRQAHKQTSKQPKQQVTQSSKNPQQTTKSSDQGKRRSKPFVAGHNINKVTKTKHSQKRSQIENKKRKPKRKLHSNTDKTTRKVEKVIIPLLKKGHVRIIPLGGVEEVGKNMTLVETNDDIFIFDVGFQFVSEEEIPGIDYIIPNTKYLEDRKDKIRGIFITHGHLDHIGGIPFIINRIGNPPIYTADLTTLLIKKRNDEFPDLKDMKIIPFNPGERMKVGGSYIRSFAVAHSIPDSMGFSIETPMGDILISGDLRLNHIAGVPSEKEIKKYTELSTHNNLFFMCDSTNAEQTGFSTDENIVIVNLERFIKEAKNRIIIGTFASQFERMIKIIELAEKYNKKIVTEGRSIKTNIEIAERAEMLKPKKGTIIGTEEMRDYPPDRIIVLSTGAQGEEFAALMRIATGKHKQIKLNERDTVILSSSVIPGNELSVQKLKDNLTRHGVTLIHYKTTDIHTSGHGNIEELMWINKKIGAKFFMPGYGYHSMLRSHANALRQTGFPKENIIIPDNGNIIDISDKKEIVVHKEKAPASIMAVDGFRIGDIQDVVIRDRKALTKDGIFVIVATVDSRTGKIQKSPDIISRGFVYLRESQDLLRQARYIAKKTIEDNTVNVARIDYDFVKDEVTENIKKFLFKQTNKRPMVLPVVLAV